MKFLITIKSKDTIYNKSKNFFNKIKTYMGSKMQYFRLDDTGEYQLLVLYFEEKGII